MNTKPTVTPLALAATLLSSAVFLARRHRSGGTDRLLPCGSSGLSARKPALAAAFRLRSSLQVY